MLRFLKRARLKYKTQHKRFDIKIKDSMSTQHIFLNQYTTVISHRTELEKKKKALQCINGPGNECSIFKDAHEKLWGPQRPFLSL